MTDSVTAIGESAFSGCSGLASAGVLHLSTALDSIAKEAFKGNRFLGGSRHGLPERLVACLQERRHDR